MQASSFVVVANGATDATGGPWLVLEMQWLVHSFIVCISLVQCVYCRHCFHVCVYAEIRCLAPFPLLPANRHVLLDGIHTNTTLTLFVQDAAGTQSYCVTTRAPRLAYDGVFAPFVFTVMYGITQREREVLVSCMSMCVCMYVQCTYVMYIRIYVVTRVRFWYRWKF